MKCLSNVRRQPIAWLVLAGLAAGCSLLGDREPAIQTREIAFDIAPDLNDDYPLAFDLVFVATPPVRTSLESMTSGDWFDQKRQLLRDFPDALSIRSYEIVPGQNVVAVHLDEREQDAIGAFLFAAYRSEGVHRARLDMFEEPVLVFGAQSLDVRDRS